MKVNYGGPIKVYINQIWQKAEMSGHQPFVSQRLRERPRPVGDWEPCCHHLLSSEDIQNLLSKCKIKQQLPVQIPAME